MVQCWDRIRGSSLLNQYVATLVVNLLSFSHGATLGWLSPFLPVLMSDESPLATGAITVYEASWIGSLLGAGELFGIIFFTYLSKVLGKKMSLLLVVLPHLGFWLFLIFGTHVYHLYIARILTGITGGALLQSVPLFVADIAQFNIRGRLGSMLPLSLTTGIFIGYTTGNFFSYYTVSYIMISVPILYLAAMSMLPDTPVSLLLRNRSLQAEKSLAFYRNVRESQAAFNVKFKEEFSTMEMTVIKERDLAQKRSFSLKDFTNKEARKGLTIGIVLMILNQCSGAFTIVNYSANIFQASGSTLTPNESSMIIGLVQIIGCYISTLLVDKVGRKVLLLVSMITGGLGLCLLGGYSYFKETGFDLTQLTWIPITSVSFVIFVSAIGICSLPFVVLAEVLPQNIRNVGSSMSVIALSVTAFFALKLFPILMETIYLYGCMWLFAGITIIGAIFIAIVLPETKGKNLFAGENNAA